MKKNPKSARDTNVTTCAARSFDFEITCMISAQIALHSVQLPLCINRIKENPKNARDTDVTIWLTVNKTTLFHWNPFATEDGISSIETYFADFKMSFSMQIVIPFVFNLFLCLCLINVFQRYPSLSIVLPRFQFSSNQLKKTLKFPIQIISIYLGNGNKLATFLIFLLE